MKCGFFLLVLLLALPAFASETTGEGQSSVKASDFHLVTFKCEPDDDEGAQTTPQSPPLDVDDPGTPGCNSWEINVIVDGDLTSSQNSWELPILDLNYGIGDNIELTYEVPFDTQVTNGASVSALGESEVALKYEFYGDEDSGTDLAIYPQVTVLAGTARAISQGLATPGTITTVPLLFSTHLARTSGGPVDITANLGYNLSTKADTTNFFSAALGVGAPLIKKVGVMAEVATQQALALDDSGTRQQLLKADLGVMGTVNKQFLLFGAVGHSLIASDQLDHSYVLAGIQLLAGGSSGI